MAEVVISSSMMCCSCLSVELTNATDRTTPGEILQQSNIFHLDDCSRQRISYFPITPAIRVISMVQRRLIT
jgi:hypothetical protein